ncbi:MAG: DMSO reductase family type II enzyme chaperone [Halobacteriales archaeon]|jgi:DMSO reductase family type II enzyme chaperone
MAASRTDQEAEYDRDATARSALYAVLARAFDNPDEQFHAAAEDGRLADEIDTYVDRSSLSIDRPAIGTDDDRKHLSATYNDLFTLGYAEYTDRTDGSLESEGPPVPLYESNYREASWNDVNVDLARAYDYFGVAVNQERRDHHDNIRLELEFAAYLARREAIGEDDAARARQDFLDRHLEPFADGLHARIKDVHDGFYADVVRLLQNVVAADLADLEGRHGGDNDVEQ